MPPSVAPRNQQIAAALMASLAAIQSGDDYWYTPTSTVVWADFGLDCLDDEMAGEHTVTYVLSPDAVDWSKPVSKHLDAIHRFDLALAKRHTNPDTPFKQDSPTRTEIQARMAGDVKKKLLNGDQTLGIQGVWDVAITVDERSADLVWHPDWAVVFLRLAVSDHHRRELA